MFGPALVDRVTDPLEANVGGEPHPVQWIAVGGGGMDHKRAVDYHISSLVVGDQPAAIEAVRHFHEVSADPAAFTHITVVCTDAFLWRKISVLRAKRGFHLAPQS